MKLRQIEHSPTGDKGNVSTISVIAFDEADYPLIAERATATFVAARFAEIAAGLAARYELRQLGAPELRHQGRAWRLCHALADVGRARQELELCAARSRYRLPERAKDGAADKTNHND